jgi:Zn-finger nucleic acid-binding protein
MGEPERLTMHEEMKKDGYSKEEEYFYKINQELIERRREELDMERDVTRLENQKEPHWMRCPKCGTPMRSESLFNIHVEQCPKCHGIYLDRGELETLLETKESGTFLRRLRKAFKLRDEGPGLF